MPTLGDVVEDPMVSLGDGGPDPKPKPKPKGKGKSGKGKGKGADPDPTIPPGNDLEPITVTTPLQKAKLLAKSVLLDLSYIIYFLTLFFGGTITKSFECFAV